MTRPLPPMPARIQALPVAPNGYPTPWFVDWNGGQPDFRVVQPERVVQAVREERCFICGQPFTTRFGAREARAFNVGPLAAITRTSAEPPGHKSCAEWAAVACPFLTRPHMRRREDNLPEGHFTPGEMLTHNPGVALVYVTDTFEVAPHGGAFLFDMNAPLSITGFAQGRPATPGEIRAGLQRSIDAARPTIPAAEWAELQRQLTRGCADLGLPEMRLDA